MRFPSTVDDCYHPRTLQTRHRVIMRPVKRSALLSSWVSCAFLLFVVWIHPSCVQALSSSSSSFSQQTQHGAAAFPKRRPATVEIFFDSSNNLHRDIQYHPEQPARIEACVEALKHFMQTTKLNNNNNNKEGDEELFTPLKLVDVAHERPVIPPSKPETNKDESNDNHDDDDITVEHEPFSTQELEHARSMLVLAHNEEFVTNFQQRCQASKQRRIDEGRSPLGFVGYIDDDTFVTTESYDVCLRATAAWIRAVDLALLGEQGKRGNNNEMGGTRKKNDFPWYGTPPRRQRRGQGNNFGTSATSISTSTAAATMALTRPPGHHATSNSANGFCIFNFASAAALHAITTYPHLVNKVSILDWDVHYGQGIADIVRAHPQIRYVSIHQTPAFPYLGEKRGFADNALQYKNVLTVPIPADTTWTCGYKELFNNVVLPFVWNDGSSTTTTADDGTNGKGELNDGEDKWEPDLVIVSAGYDALGSDELANVALTAEDYGRMTRLLMERIGWLEEDGNDNAVDKENPMSGRRKPGLMFGLEGGYQLGKMAAGGNLADAVVETVKALLR